MTTIFSRYVFRQAAGALLLILSSLSGIVWIALALRQFEVVTSQGQNAWTLLAMTTLGVPNLLALIAPFALLIAVMHTLNRLNGDSELIVMTASGGTIWIIARPLLLLAAIVATAVTFVNHIGMPWSLRMLRDYVVEVRTDLLSQVLQPGKFSSPESGVTFHIRERAPNGDILGLIMHDTRTGKSAMSYLAERGHIVKQESGSYMIMSGGHVLSQDDIKQPPRIVAFDRYALDLDAFDQKISDDKDLRPRERYYSELVNPDPESRIYKRNRGQFRAELHERFASPLYPLAFVFIALAAAGGAQSTRTNRTRSIVMGFAAGAGLRLAGLGLNNLVSVNPVMIPLLYLLPLGAIAISLVLIQRAGQQRPGQSRTSRLLDSIGEMASNIAARLRPGTPKPAGST
ncbi:MAG: LPS export ABC transporter permease LptF [Hyphomicrobium sp.]|nr:LPS export ABC transporter permease LptF [Hyphomicrobium sp.]PPD08287.1 MAG: LPS export ABC transporter permease LptF [Hyphomicrobium sp.]